MTYPRPPCPRRLPRSLGLEHRNRLPVGRSASPKAAEAENQTGPEVDRTAPAEVVAAAAVAAPVRVAFRTVAVRAAVAFRTVAVRVAAAAHPAAAARAAAARTATAAAHPAAAARAAAVRTATPAVPKLR